MNNVYNTRNDKQNSYTQSKALPDVFKELKMAQQQQIVDRIQLKNNLKPKNRVQRIVSNAKSKIGNRDLYRTKRNKFKMHNSFKYKIKNFRFGMRDVFTKKNIIPVLMIGAIGIFGITLVSNNNIIAKEDDVLKEKKKEIIGSDEENKDAINLSQILTNNINTTESKELLTVQRQVPFETEYRENNKLPKNEQVIVRGGVSGVEEISFIRTYENAETVNDVITDIRTVENSISQIVDVGTNEFLDNQKIHIGDKLYAKDRTPLYSEMNENSELLGTIIQNYDVKLLDVLENNWSQVQIFDYIGYVKNENFISANIAPEMVDKCRRQKLLVNVNENMNMNRKSGFNLLDYQIALSDNSGDRYKIFEQNAEVFYNMEQKYNVNGFFLAAIGIHESAWGTSTIAQNKKNLFGYGSYDSDPYNMSYSFGNFSDGIELVAKMLVKYYLNPAGTTIYNNEIAVGSYYNGSTIKAVNVRYASDPEWNTKVYNTMKRLYDKITP